MLDVGNKSTSKLSSVIYIDSSRITVEQGESHLYLDVSSKQKQETNFIYKVLNYNDETCTVIFSPENMTFDYQSSDYHLRYFIDSIQQEQKEFETTDDEGEEPSDSTETDSVKEDNKIYLTAEVPPEFPGGSDAMKQWLIDHTKYPAEAKREKIIGLVEVSAVIEKNGSLSDVKVKRDIGGGCGAEATRAVKQMPSWIPGQIKGEDKRVQVTIKVFFPPK